MPIYQYQGQQYNISTDDPAEAKSKILSYLEKGSREKSSAIGDIAAGLNSAVNTMGQGVIYSGASLAGALGADETSQNLFNVYNKYDKQFDEAESKVDRGEGGKVLKAIGQIPAYLNPITAGMMIGGGGIKTGTDIINEGGSEDAAKKAQAFDMASSTAMYALGPLTNIPGRVANAGLQAGINVAQEAGINRPVQNMIRENADLRRLPDMTIGDYGAAAVPGAVFGALSPKKGKPGETPLPDGTPTVDVDKAYVARKEATLHSIEKQVLMLEKQIASIKPRDDGTYSEKQMKFIQSLEEQKQGKMEEAVRVKKNIDAYAEPDQAAKIAALSTEDILGKDRPDAEDLAEFDLNSQISKYSSETGLELGGVSHLKGIIEQLQAAYIQYGPDAGQALLDDMASRAPDSSGFSEEIKASGFIEQLHQELSKRAKDFNRKVGSDTTPIEDQFVGDTSPEAMYKSLATKQNIDSLFTEYKKFLDSTTDGGFGKVLDIQNLSPEEIASQIESLSSKSMSMREGMSSKQQETLARMGANLSKAFFNRYGKHVDEFVNTPTTTNKQKVQQEPVSNADDAYSTENLLSRFGKEKPKARPISEIAKELRDVEEQYTTLIKEGKYGEAKLVARSKDLLKKEFFAAKANNKQRGSWTPFADMDDGRPDDSNAPGILRPQTEKKRFGFKKFTEEQQPEDFRNPRHKQPPPPLDEGLTMAEWAVTDDGIDPMKPPYRVVPVMVKRKQPDGSFKEVQATDKNGELEVKHEYYDSREMGIWNQRKVDLERAGIMETPVGDESDVRFQQRKFQSPESANNHVKRLEGQVESQRKAVKKLQDNLHTPIGSEIEFENAKIKLSEMETRLGHYRSKDMGWKEDKVSKPQITEIFSLDDDANKTPEQVKQDRIDAGLDPLPQPPRGPGFKQRGSINLFLSNEKAKETDTAAIASRLKNQQFDKVVDVTNLRSSDEMLAEMGNGQAKDYGGFLTKGERAMFGFQQFVEAVKRKAPLVWEQAKRIRQAESGEVEAKRLIWHGKNTSGFSGILGFRKLKHTQNPDSMETLLPSLSMNDKIVLTEWLNKNSQLLQRHEKADTTGLTDKQKVAIPIIQKFYDDVQELGGMKRRNGYVHANFKGDFLIGIKTSKDDILHYEPAPTKEIAEKLEVFLTNKGYNTTDIIDFKDVDGTPLADSFNTVKSVLESLQDRLPGTDSANALHAIDDVQAFMSEHATAGKHNVRAGRVTGYKGTSLVKSRSQNANDFFNGFKNYLDEVAAQTKKNKLTEETTKFWETDAGRKLKEEFPNQYDTAMYLTDVSMNRKQDFYIKNSKGEEVAIVKTFDDNARKVIDDFIARQIVAIDKNLAKQGKNINEFLGKKKFKEDFNPFYYPEVPVLDRTIGLAAQLFYIRTLTSRPAFWAGQILSSPFAVRQFLKEGTVLDTLTAQGKAWGTIMSGGDAEFKAFFNDIRQSRDSIRPQFIVDINRVPLFEDIKHPTLNKIFMWGTGQEQAGIADAASRYFALAMAYHFYKDQGLSGSKLKENATHMAELTMQMYNRANSPPVLNKLGILGQNIAPLQKFGLGQLQNLIGDIRYMMDQPGFAGKLRGSLPALSTLMVTTIMGGTQGISLLTEYEILRYLLVKAGSAIGEDWSELFPSAIENMMKHQNWFQKGVQKGYEGLGASEEFAKDASTHGLPSAATGFDIGSSLRFNPYVGEGLIKQNYSPIDNFPLVKQMIDMAVTTSVKARKVLGGDVDEAEDRKADLSMQVFTGQNYLIDKFKHKSDTRDFVPGGGRLYGQVPQTQKEQIGQIIGSPSLETAKARKTVELMDRKEKQIAQKRQDAIDLLADAVTEGDQKGIDRAIELALKAEMDHKQIMQGLKAAMAQRNKSRLDAMTTNQKGFPSSKEQKRKYMERLQYE